MTWWTPSSRKSATIASERDAPHGMRGGVRYTDCFGGRMGVGTLKVRIRSVTRWFEFRREADGWRR